MKNKQIAEEPPTPKTLGINDMVITPLSERLGKVVKIEEKMPEFNHWLPHAPYAPYKLYTVSIPMPWIKQERFSNVTIDFRDYELTRSPI